MLGHDGYKKVIKTNMQFKKLAGLMMIFSFFTEQTQIDIFKRISRVAKDDDIKILLVAGTL